jgi:hypothetical protein
MKETMKNKWLLLSGMVLWVAMRPAAADPPLNENRFQERLKGVAAESDPNEKLRRAKDLAGFHWLSSLQVKAIASRLPDDAARLEFATAAYPRTVDPENFYEVYDAFSSFSKVMRLHDRVRNFPSAPPPPIVAAPATVTEEELQEILRALRKASFDNSRQQTARQILAGSSKRFLSSQIKRVVDCFDFEPSRLEIAQFAYDFTLDREKYFLVNDAFTFDQTKVSLSRYLEAKNAGVPPKRP